MYSLYYRYDTYENRLNDDKNILKYRATEQGLSKRAKIQNYIYMILNFPVLDFLSSENKSMMMFFLYKKEEYIFFK